MRATNIAILLFLASSPAYSSSSIYGSAFDYTKATPTSQYFAGKTEEQIQRFCKNDALATMDVSACAQHDFERVAQTLEKKVSAIERIMADGDKELRTRGEPEALPYFRRGQENWKLYRDNECYADVYEVGQASLRFVEFWDCMTRITRNRLDELTKPINE
ncbi:lysozyme inhibitor LprI family protein [Paraburkholderia sp. 35.1]|uniref:lysozyme inhibitor LprI family protein n=1 Tax=Paraburkholderia sp. 35.1 TaxID=2991058 RepID=UPI003D1FC6D6